MEEEKLQEILAAHKDWLESDGKKGERAIFCRAYLGYVDFSGVDLSCMDFKDANLEGANLDGANLDGANLTAPNLEGAKGIVSIGPMPKSGRMVYFIKHAASIMVQSGCFWGTIDELRAKAKEEDKPWYITAIAHAECVLT